MVRLKISNARNEPLNNRVRVITRRASGFHAATAALALAILTCGPIRRRRGPGPITGGAAEPADPATRRRRRP